MPVENELKFVLNLEAECKIRDFARITLDIKQGYLVFNDGVAARIRSTDPVSCDGFNPRYEFTFKKTINGEVIELEHQISKIDFEKLWAVAFNKLEKIRHIIFDEKGYKWEIDSFKKDGKTYFLMAEHEMPEGQTEPIRKINFVYENLLYAVPKEDARFSSGRLGDKEYAEKLLLALKRSV